MNYGPRFPNPAGKPQAASLKKKLSRPMIAGLRWYGILAGLYDGRAGTWPNCAPKGATLRSLRDRGLLNENELTDLGRAKLRQLEGDGDQAGEAVQLG